MQGPFQKVGLVGRSQQEGLDAVLQELLALLDSRGHSVMLENRLDELLPGHGVTLASRDEIG